MGDLAAVCLMVEALVWGNAAVGDAPVIGYVLYINNTPVLEPREREKVFTQVFDLRQLAGLRRQGAVGLDDQRVDVVLGVGQRDEGVQAEVLS